VVVVVQRWGREGCGGMEEVWQGMEGENRLEMLRQKGQTGWLLLLKMVACLSWYRRSFVVVLCGVELCLIVNCQIGVRDARETSFGRDK
jgi:hypothetical protein